MVSTSAIRASQRDERGLVAGSGHVNVGESERLASQIGGGVLIFGGLMRGGLGGLTMAALGGALMYRGVSGHCRLYQALGANTALGDEPGPMSSIPAQHGVHIEEAITIDRPPEELYRYWRDYANLPKFMEDVESVTPSGENRSHWVVKAPLGRTVEWDAEIHNETPNELIAWRTLEGSDVDTAGSVHFRRAPGGRGTEVRVVQKVNPPGGKLGVAVARLFGEDPGRHTRESLRRLKQLMETGEIPTTAGQPSGRRAG